MALKFRHIDTQQTLNTVKFSADSTNTTYFLHSSPSTQLQGAPDVNYEDICFIKPTGQEYTHGKLYGGENNNNFTDSFADYLNDLYSKVHTNIILTGGNWYELSDTKKVSPGFVYIHTVGIVYVDTKFLTSISFSQLGEPSIYRYTFDENYESLPKKDWNYEYSYTAFSNPMPDYKPNFHIEKVCDWSDLKYLYKISIENASRVRDGLMSKEDKIKLDSHTDGYLDYLHKLCTEHSKYAIILSGCTVEPTNVQDTYQRKGGYVYINSINQIKKVNDGTISYSTTIEDSLYCNSQNGGNSKTYAFGDATNPSNLDNQYAKVCNWSDLVRLSDLEVPVATNYQNGLITATEKELLQGLNNYSGFTVSYGNDRYCQFFKNGAIIFIRGFLDINKRVVINNVNSKYHGLIPCSYNDGGYKYDSSGAGTITFTANDSWGTLFVLTQYYNAINVDNSDITITDV